MTQLGGLDFLEGIKLSSSDSGRAIDGKPQQAAGIFMATQDLAEVVGVDFLASRRDFGGQLFVRKAMPVSIDLERMHNLHSIASSYVRQDKSCTKRLRNYSYKQNSLKASGS